jgi:DtxR family Mn-dependent transcriptional regulator
VSEKLSASLEDYLEAIYHLTAGQGVARSKDIAEAMAVSRASVTGALRSLSEKELVNYKPYGYITLTKKGQRIARRVAHRHEILTRFFEGLLGAKASTAQAAACRAEFVSKTQDEGLDIAQQFQNYWLTEGQDQE